MNFINDAERSFVQITCKTMRTILHQCAAEILRQIVAPRTRNLSVSSDKDMELTDDGGIKAQILSDSIQVTEEDINRAYNTTRTVGRRWMKKLIASDDKQDRKVSKALEIILRNGKFLEKYHDDIELDLFKFHRQTQKDQEDSSCSSDSSEDIPTALSTRQRTSPLPVQRRHLSAEEVDKNIASMVETNETLPHTKLLKIGQLDPCNLHSNTTAIEDGTSSEWHPLPAIVPTGTSQSSAVHIPDLRMLPADKLQKRGDDQLYGKIALTLPNPMNVQEQIAAIDEMAQSYPVLTHTTVDGASGRCKNQTMWPHGWDIIQKQADANKERLHPPKSKKGSSVNEDGEIVEEVMEFIPRSLLGDGLVLREEQNKVNSSAADQEGENIDANTNVDATVPANNDLIFISTNNDGETQRISTTTAFQKTWMSTRIKRKWSENEGECKGEIIETVSTEPRDIVGRKPSGCSARLWSSDQIKSALGDMVREKLEETMIHDDKIIGQEYNSCQGALKMVGNIHLWEQADFLTKNDDLIGSDEKAVMKFRKSVHRKAKRQRLLPNYEAGTKGYHDSKLTSKVIRVEEGKLGPPTRDSSVHQCMELDLADCFISLVPLDYDPRDKLRKMLAFRSLEVSLYE